MVIFHDVEDTGPVEGLLNVYVPKGGPIVWNATASGDITISPDSGMAYPGDGSYILVSVTDSALGYGRQHVGQVNIVAYAYGEDSDPDNVTVPITVHVGDFDSIALPSISK